MHPRRLVGILGVSPRHYSSRSRKGTASSRRRLRGADPSGETPRPPPPPSFPTWSARGQDDASVQLNPNTCKVPVTSRHVSRVTWIGENIGSCCTEALWGARLSSSPGKDRQGWQGRVAARPRVGLRTGRGTAPPSPRQGPRPAWPIFGQAARPTRGQRARTAGFTEPTLPPWPPSANTTRPSSRSGGQARPRPGPTGTPLIRLRESALLWVKSPAGGTDRSARPSQGRPARDAGARAWDELAYPPRRSPLSARSTLGFSGHVGVYRALVALCNQAAGVDLRGWN